MDVHNTQLHRSLQGKWYTQTESASWETEGKPRKEMKDAVPTKDTNASVLHYHHIVHVLKDNYFNKACLNHKLSWRIT